MQEKEYNDTKKEIRSLLLTYPKGVMLEDFLKTYKNILGGRLPSKTFGFPTDIAFLKSMPDVVNVNTEAYGKILLIGIADEKSQHIQKLVSKQRNIKPNKNKSSKRQPIHKPLSSNVFNVKETKPYLPGPLRAEILQLIADYPSGVSLPGFALAYRRKYNKCLPLVRGLNTLEDMIKLIPQFEIEIFGNEKRICYKDDTFLTIVNSEKDIPVTMTNGNVKTAKNSFNVHESGVPNDVLESFQQILQKYPEGIVDLHFPAVYEKMTGKSFDLHEFGYNSILDLVDALPYIFKRIKNREDNKSWIILPADIPVKQDLLVDNKKTPEKTIGIPADASSPILQYIQPFIPRTIDLTKYVPVFVSAIINPSLFWFQLQPDDATINFEAFEKDMGAFYNTESYKYKMNDSDIIIGASCVILCPEDKQWYRAVIKSIPNLHLINVSYIDYGSNENIPRENLFYVRSKYHDFPAHAFKAQLAGIKPSNNESLWSIESRQRFVELCSYGILMANLKSVNKDTYSVYLCDTNGEEDIHLNDVLVNEGFAVWRCDNDINVNSPENSCDEINLSDGFKADSLSELSSKSDQDMLQSDKNDSFSELESLPLNRRLSFPLEEVQCDTLSPTTITSGSKENCKRFVKLLQLCEGIKMYFINVDNKLYMPCANISKLIWTDKNTDFLVERLKYKGIDIPFLNISKDDHAELFNQCIWLKIPEFEILKKDNSSLELCSLEWALKILNVFGHPSVCIRLAIQNESRKFNPLDSVWKEFYYEETCDLNDIEKEITQSISKLCLYDLKVKNEAFKIKRLKLLRLQNNPESDEIKIIDVHQKIIGRRMKQIEDICSQYSSCS